MLKAFSLQLKKDFKGMKCATSQRTLLQENTAQDHVDVCFGETTQRLSKSREETPLVKSDSFYFVFFQMRTVQTT